MRTGIFLNYTDGFLDAVDQVVELEKVGVDLALVAEAYSYDAISQLGFLAARTSRMELGTGVVPIYVRTPPHCWRCRRRAWTTCRAEGSGSASAPRDRR